MTKHAARIAGHGEVINVLEAPFLLVQVNYPSEPNQFDLSDDAVPEPKHMLVLSLNEKGLRFFNSYDEHETWMAYIESSDPEAKARFDA